MLEGETLHYKKELFRTGAVQSPFLYLISLQLSNNLLNYQSHLKNRFLYLLIIEIWSKTA